MSEKWVQDSKKILDQIQHLETKKGDRLELVRSIRFVLVALERSLLGWKQWVNNPDIMIRFTQEDLDKMKKKMSNLTCSFIEYDIDATELGAKRGLKTKKEISKRKKGKAGVSYVA